MSFFYNQSIGATSWVLLLALILGVFPAALVSGYKFEKVRVGILMCLCNFAFAVFINVRSIHTQSINIVEIYAANSVAKTEIYPIITFMTSFLVSIIVGLLNAYLQRHLTIDILNDVIDTKNFIKLLNGKLYKDNHISKFFTTLYLLVISCAFYVGYDIIQHFQYNGPLVELIEYLGIDWCSMIPLCIESLFGIFCLYICECLDQICISPCKNNGLLLRVFVHMCATVGKINERFGVDFLISIAIARITLLSSLFTLICSLLGLGNFESLNPVYLCSYATSSFARTYFVCYFCRKVILKIEETKLELFNRCIAARQMKNEPIPLAMKCIMNRKKIAAFDACGFIEISMDLLGEIIGSVITYLVVLVQFQFLKQ